MYTALLLVLALTNVATGDLLRPCECGPDNPYSCGRCPASKSADVELPPPC